MARPKKKPEYDSDQMAQQIMEAVTDAYLNPPQGMEDDAGHMQLNQLAEEFSMTPLKVRKLLITTGAYQTAISKAVNMLFREGKSVAEIQELTNLSRASVQSYLPYSKTVYKMEERTLLAERLQKYRSRKAAADRIVEAMASEASSPFFFAWAIFLDSAFFSLFSASVSCRSSLLFPSSSKTLSRSKGL